MNTSDLGEFGLIKRLGRILPRLPKAVVGIGDDTAVLPYTKDKYLLFTTDMMAEGVHFTKAMDPKGVGHKAIACNISDIAAMGGIPKYAVVSLGVSKKTSVAYIEKIYKGLAQTAKNFNVAVVGGDTIKADQLVVSIALIGDVDKKHLVLRSGAQKGDWVFVSGPLGGSLKSGRHLTFTPALDKAQFLVRRFKPSAMLDISDGLAGDLNHLLVASGVGVKLWLDAVPLHAGVALAQALSDGEDYELVFTLNARKAKSLMCWQFKHKRFYFYPIGEITANKKEMVHAKSYTHF